MIVTAALNPDPTLVSLAGTMAPLASVGLFLAPMPTIRHVMKEKTVGNLPLLPHTTMLSNAFLWVTYGTQIVFSPMQLSAPVAYTHY
jgi:hypothetical protein